MAHFPNRTVSGITLVLSLGFGLSCGGVWLAGEAAAFVPEGLYRLMLLFSFSGAVMIGIIAFLLFLRGKENARRREAEERLRQSEELFREVAEEIPLLVCRFLPGGKILYVNQHYCDYFGKTAEELAGASFLELIPEHERTRVMQNFSALTPEHPTRTCEHQVTVPEGALRWQRWTDHAVFDADGTLRAYQSVGEDVTALRMREGQRKKLALAVEQSPAVVMITDTLGRIEYVNPRFCELSGFTPEEVLGTEATVLGETPEALHREMWETIRRGRTWRGEFLNRRKEGGSYREQAAISPLRNERGIITHYIKVAEDVTYQKALEEELGKREELMIAQSRQAAMGEMIGMIAHQWRQPIATIGMAANNLLLDIEMDAFDPEEFRETLETVNRQVKHLSKTIDDFRDFFRPQKEKEWATLSGVMEQTLEIIGKSLENNNITVEKEYGPERRLFTYPRELIQVFLNLLGNAKEVLAERKTPAPRIAIRIFQAGEGMTASIRDNGGGVGERHEKRIFEPYFTTKKQTGTGLGLYMSKTIVEKHLGGTLAFDNRDGGACFTVTIPPGPEEETP